MQLYHVSGKEKNQGERLTAEFLHRQSSELEQLQSCANYISIFVCANIVFCKVSTNEGVVECVPNAKTVSTEN